jgi:glycosyltransferase involved in cell wall biosynthesis
MRVLQLTHKPPLPLIDGGCIAMHQITQSLLQNRVAVDVLSIATPKHPFKKELYTSFNAQAAFVDTSIQPFKAFRQSFKTQPYILKRFESKDFETLIIETLKKNSYDVIHFESLYTTPYLEVIKKHTNAKLVYRPHNVEHNIWEANASLEKNAFKKAYLQRMTKQLKKVEETIPALFDAIVPISTTDEDFFKKHFPKKAIKTISIGIDTPAYSNHDNHSSFFHIGAMDWLPNQQGLDWFIENVWKEFHTQHPNTSLELAGKAISKKYAAFTEYNIHNHGEVKSAADFMQENGVMIVPLFSGSGIRVKILEAMALGKTVIATAIAAKGIPCTHQKDILIANTKEEFLSQLNKCIKDEAFVKSIGENAHQLIHKNFNINILGENLVSFYQQITN